ncbi:unnamed protein product [Alopecurus aequalis]
MSYNEATYTMPHIIRERLYPDDVVVENALRVWAISSWRTPEALARWFIGAGYTHLPPRSPVMVRLEQLRWNANIPPSGLVVYFTNRFDAELLLGQVFWLGCEFIAFTTYNIFTNLDGYFRGQYPIHSLPY